MSVIIAIGRVLLQLIYNIHKIAPVRNRIAIISRQGNRPSLDIKMLEARIKEEMPDYEVVVLCKRLDNKPAYLWHMITVQMHALATSRIAVLDSYCIAVSILNHRDSLRVIQMWHALGAYKKFGKSILDKPEGSTSKIAESMRMHRGYDKILASSAASVPAFGEAFGYSAGFFSIIPLPRVDLLRDQDYLTQKRDEILSAHPELSGKEVILYAPTFRKGVTDFDRIEEFIDAVDGEKYALILTNHPLVRDSINPEKAISISGYTTMELLSVSDHFVTDYSAMAYESCLAGVKTYFYTYDIDEYIEARGFYLDPYKDLPIRPVRTASEVIERIESSGYDTRVLERFADRYIENRNDCTSKIVSLIREMIEDSERQDKRN